jgi:DNA-binding transcriptional regulator YiaG
MLNTELEPIDIVEFRKKYKQTQVEFWNYFGLSARTGLRYENGKVKIPIHLKALIRLLINQRLDQSFEDLLDYLFERKTSSFRSRI